MTKRSAERGRPVWGCVIVAAGASSRFGGDVPKQFLSLAGRRVVDWSVETALSIGKIREVILVVPDDWEDSLADLPRSAEGASVRVTRGGARRQDSVLAGLSELRQATHVLVHDGARPLASRELWLSVMESTLEAGAAVPVSAVDDTVKKLSDDGSVEATLDRGSLGLAQTPQGFAVRELLEALGSASETGELFTDESSILEAAGARVATVPGERSNIKITKPGDIAVASVLLTGESPLQEAAERRTGLGVDLHPFSTDRDLVVGGCRFEDSEMGLAGHSDGDVLLHSISDALLAAAGLGDIGVLYPSTDPCWEGADSGDLLNSVVARLSDAGWIPVRIDATLIGDRPRVSLHRERLIERIAELCGLPESSVWVKGKSGNDVGFAGRGEGLAAISLAEVERIGPGARPGLQNGGQESSSG
jgi:2-C-methyl-D-erythritol 4-phosphate cytidylyltransferase/2-C-methyl-D-erythritol 2,4-cyclodiphosphate synthase